MRMRLALLVVLAVAAVDGCDSATVVPPGAQPVHVQMTSAGLHLEPGIAAPGDVYLVLEEPLHGVEFIHRSTNMGDIHAPAMPLSDADIAAVREQGTFQGAVIESISLHAGNTVKIGPLVEGKYALVEENPTLSVAILEVRQ